MQLSENGLHHAPVEAALCHVLQVRKHLSAVQQPKSIEDFLLSGKEKHQEQTDTLHGHLQCAQDVIKHKQPIILSAAAANTP